MFQLEKSLEDWKRNLNSSNSLTQPDIDELESHLLDEIDDLKQKNLTDEESFYVACSRIGSSDLLSNEFSKVNANYIWLKKILWLLSGYLLINFSYHLTSLLSLAATTAIYSFTRINLNGTTYLNLTLNAILSTTILCILFLPRFIIISKLYSKFNYLFNYKRHLLMFIFLLFIFMNSIGFNLLKAVFKLTEPMEQFGYMMMGESLFSLIWPAIICLMVMYLALKNHSKNKTIG